MLPAAQYSWGQGHGMDSHAGYAAWEGCCIVQASLQLTVWLLQRRCWHSAVRHPSHTLARAVCLLQILS